MTKPTTIEDVIGTFVSLKFDVDSDEFSDGTLARWHDMLATIEQLVLERVIGEDYSFDDRAFPTEVEVASLYDRNRLIEVQRKALKKLLGGKNE